MTKTVSDPYATSEDCPYGHVWVGGMMYVHTEDLDTVARERAANGLDPVECERCETIYVDDSS